MRRKYNDNLLSPSRQSPPFYPDCAAAIPLTAAALLSMRAPAVPTRAGWGRRGLPAASLHCATAEKLPVRPIRRYGRLRLICRRCGSPMQIIAVITEKAPPGLRPAPQCCTAFHIPVTPAAAAGKSIPLLACHTLRGPNDPPSLHYGLAVRRPDRQSPGLLPVILRKAR